MIIEIYTDGASRGNPGKSASGYLFLDEKGKPLFSHVFYNGICTNNKAEYTAIIEALKTAASSYGKDNEIRLYSDSELVVNQLSGKYKIREAHLKPLYGEAIALLETFSGFSIQSVRRENKNIASVDQELNMLLDRVEKNPPSSQKTRAERQRTL
ncbi:ribonuclease HI family protein [Candidatus Marsarchaeota archaeon]|nr:ribonuclease HI family protein [Candidatus Marsarchaeota archaeon]